MLRCQALRAPSCAALRGAAAARPLRLRPARITCAASPDGSLPGGPGGPGKPKSSSSRRAASRGGAGSTGQGEQERLDSGLLPPFAMHEPEAEGPMGAASAGSGALLHGAAPASAAAEDSSWESWQQYFYEMDDVVQEMEAVESELEEAVQQEDYRSAAALKAQLTELEAADCVGAALAELQAAVEEERFADAAALRDESGASLLGWWVGRAEDDAVGHLLRITRDFGRLVGTVYSARDITDLSLVSAGCLCGYLRDPGAVGGSAQPAAGDPRLSALAAAMMARNGGSAGIVVAGPPKPEDVGLPVLEVFLRRAPEGCPSGRRYEQQTAALYAPAVGAAPCAALSSVPGPPAPCPLLADPGSSVVSIEQGQNEDGSAFMKIEIGSVAEDEDDEEVDFQQAAADYGQEEDDDGIRTIDDLAASVGVQDIQELASSSSDNSSGRQGDEASASRGEVDEEEAEELARWRQEAASGSGPAIPEEVDALTAALLGAAEAAQSQQWPGEGGEEDEDVEVVEVPETAAKLGSILQRTPAQITWEGRDHFTVTVSEPPALVQQRRQYELTAAASVAAAGVPPLQRPPVRIIYDDKEQLRQQQHQQQQGAEDEQQQQQESEARAQQPGEAQGPAAAAAAAASSSSSISISSSRRNPDGSVDVEVTAEESDSEEISVLLSPAQQAQQAAQTEQQQRAEDSAALAERIDRVREQLESGAKVDKDLINDIARRAMGLAIAQGITSANAAGTALAERWAAMEGHTHYQRLPLNFCKTDPFDGLYVGTFGPHGPELLQVSRQVEGGQEWVVATKLTGDPNVPAGTVSWKALIGRGNRLPVEMYPAEMAVTARYRGQGQVAQAGFQRPKWVDGELLVFGADSAFVQGAQLGFTFDVNKSQRFLIVLHRVDLDDVFSEEED
ncbi:hypothetical protein ABPG75_009311 [Micractinium tetrahymenae]